MAQITRDPLELAVELEEERLALEAAREAEHERRDHEYRIAKLKYATQPKYKSIERVITAVTKAPALGIALICITVLVSRGKEVPESLTKFITV